MDVDWSKIPVSSRPPQKSTVRCLKPWGLPHDRRRPLCSRRDRLGDGGFDEPTHRRRHRHGWGLLLLLLADQILGGNRILPIQDGLSGFSHKAVVMIGALYVVAAGLRETGGVHLIAGKLLGRPKGLLRLNSA